MNEYEIKLRNALELAFIKEWQELDEEVISLPQYEFPEGYREKVLKKSYGVLESSGSGFENRRVNTQLEFHGRPRIRRALLVAVLIALMVIGAVTAYALTHPEIIYNIKKTFTEWTFHFQQTDPDSITEEFVPIKPETPEGFEIVSEEIVPETLYMIQYTDDEGRMITYDQSEIKSLGLTISAAGDVYKEIEINNYKALVYHDSNEWNIIWDNGYYLFTVGGNCDYDILLKMAESIE